MSDACRVCGEATPAVFGINFKPVPICESCATQIAAQQVEWWSLTSQRLDDLQDALAQSNGGPDEFSA